MASDERESFLNPSEAAELLGVHPRTLSRWEQAGKLHVIRTVGGHRRYRRSEVLALRTVAAPARHGRQSSQPGGAEDRSSRGVRRRALEMLHAADVSGSDARAGLGPKDPPAVRRLVEGVSARREEIDAIIAARSEHWTVERMPVVDRNVLRIGVWELLEGGVRPGEVVGEAVALARMLSTEDSGRFVNGLLSRIAREPRA